MIFQSEEQGSTARILGNNNDIFLVSNSDNLGGAATTENYIDSTGPTGTQINSVDANELYGSTFKDKNAELVITITNTNKDVHKDGVPLFFNKKRKDKDMIAAKILYAGSGVEKVKITKIALILDSIPPRQVTALELSPQGAEDGIMKLVIDGSYTKAKDSLNIRCLISKVSPKEDKTTKRQTYHLKVNGTIIEGLNVGSEVAGISEPFYVMALNTRMEKLSKMTKYSIFENTDKLDEEFGRNSLMLAVISNDLDKMVDAVFNKVNVHAMDKRGKNALMYAADCGFLRAVKFLIGHKACENKTKGKGKITGINATDDEEQTALMYAEDRPDTDDDKKAIIKILRDCSTPAVLTDSENGSSSSCSSSSSSSSSSSPSQVGETAPNRCIGDLTAYPPNGLASVGVINDEVTYSKIRKDYNNAGNDILPSDVYNNTVTSSSSSFIPPAVVVVVAAAHESQVFHTCTSIDSSLAISGRDTDNKSSSDIDIDICEFLVGTYGESETQPAQQQQPQYNYITQPAQQEEPQYNCQQQPQYNYILQPAQQQQLQYNCQQQPQYNYIPNTAQQQELQYNCQQQPQHNYIPHFPPSTLQNKRKLDIDDITDKDTDSEIAKSNTQSGSDHNSRSSSSLEKRIRRCALCIPAELIGDQSQIWCHECNPNYNYYSQFL